MEEKVEQIVSQVIIDGDDDEEDLGPSTNINMECLVEEK